MSSEPRVLKASDLLGRRVPGTGGRVADLVTETGPDGRERVVRAYVLDHPWGRLFGYERADTGGPWLLRRIALRILRRHAEEIPIDSRFTGYLPPP